MVTLGGIITGILILALIYIISPRYAYVGNWSHLFRDMNHDPQEFYNSVEQLLRGRKVPNLTTGIKHFKQGSVLSYHRIYLEVRRGDYAFHICAAPWGNDFFFSWWLTHYDTFGDRMLRKIPFLNAIMDDTKAYYKLDSDTMFRTSVHECVQSAIDYLTAAKGVRELTELERKPDLKSLINGRD